MTYVICNRKQGSVFVDTGGLIRFFDHSYQTHKNAGPAFITSTGIIQYMDHGRLHRINGPAMIFYDGRKEYWVDDTELTSSEFFIKYGAL